MALLIVSNKIIQKHTKNKINSMTDVCCGLNWMKFVTELTPIFVTHSTFFSQTEMSHLCKCVINIVTRQHFYKVGQNPVSKEKFLWNNFIVWRLKSLNRSLIFVPNQSKNFSGFSRTFLIEKNVFRSDVINCLYWFVIVAKMTKTRQYKIPLTDSR